LRKGGNSAADFLKPDKSLEGLERRPFDEQRNHKPRRGGFGRRAIVL
jgi:hypothetical protein